VGTDNARKEAMNYGQSITTPAFKLHSTPMMTSAALIGAGSLIGLAGLIVGGTAMWSAARKWFLELEVPPSEVVKHKWHQAKAATNAGASAWHQHNGAPARTHA
jgi:hypothetical protein